MRLFGSASAARGRSRDRYRSLGSYHEGTWARRRHSGACTRASGRTTARRGSSTSGSSRRTAGGGSQAAAQLQEEFRAYYFAKAATLQEIQFRATVLHRLLQAIIPFEDSLHEAATDGRNDEVYLPVELLFRFTPEGPTGFGSTGEWTIRRSKRLGDYLVTLKYSYDRITEVLIQ